MQKECTLGIDAKRIYSRNRCKNIFVEWQPWSTIFFFILILFITYNKPKDRIVTSKDTLEIKHKLSFERERSPPLDRQAH